MKTDLFFCGDSDTYGMELEGLEKDHTKRESLRFSNLVAQDLGKTHHNISESGACNDWIVKNTIDWFEAGNVCETAVIQFSAPRRWGYYDSEEVYQNMPNNNYKFDMKWKEDQLIAHQVYYESIWSMHLELDNYWKNLFFLHNYLQYKCQVLFNTLSTKPVPGVGKYEKFTTNSWYDLCKNIEIGEHRIIVQGHRCPFIDRSKGLMGSHPSAQGHRSIADDILRRLARKT
jgi:hypothetical protein